MKADRLIALLLTLQSRRQCCARILAERLEVSERTIYRDVEALSAAGVPVYAERGANGGIVLADGYRRALTHFSDDEIRALFVSGASPLADLDVEGGFARALEKLHGGLAGGSRRAAEKARSRIHLDRRRWNQPAPSRELLTAVRLAVWDDRRLRIRYEDRNGARSTRVVDPLGLVSKAGVWYLVCRCEGELRSLRIDRMRRLDELGERFERPDGFDLERYWNESSARFAQTSRSYDCIATFCVRNDAIERLTLYWPAEIASRNRGESLVRVTFPGNQVALFQALAWSDVATLLEPEELRGDMIAAARRTLKLYAGE